MIDREQWMRENRFKKLAHLLWKELQANKGNEEAILAQRLYEDIVPYILDAALKRFRVVLQERMTQGEPIYVDISDLSMWPEDEKE